MEHHVRVGRVLLGRLGRVGAERLDDAAPDRATGVALGEEALRTHPAVAVGRLPVAEVDGVHHAVAVEPVVAAHRVVLRVGAVAHVDAVQVVGDAAVENLEPAQSDLVVGRCVGTLEVRVGLDRGPLCLDVQGHRRYYIR